MPGFSLETGLFSWVVWLFFGRLVGWLWAICCHWFLELPCSRLLLRSNNNFGNWLMEKHDTNYPKLLGNLIYVHYGNFQSLVMVATMTKGNFPISLKS